MGGAGAFADEVAFEVGPGPTVGGPGRLVAGSGEGDGQLALGVLAAEGLEGLVDLG